MILEKIGLTLAGALKSLALRPATQYLQVVLANEKAFEFARNQVRAEFEAAILPAVYDHVVDGLRLSKNDFIRFYQATRHAVDAESVDTCLRDQLREKLQTWVHNVPDRSVLDRLIQQFYRAYETYYLTTDPQLATLHLVDVSERTLENLRELRHEISVFAKPLGLRQRHASPEEVLAILARTQIIYDVIERSDTRLELEITEQGTVFPSKVLVCYISTPVMVSDVDDVATRSHSAKLTRSVLVVGQLPTVEVHRYAERRGVLLLSLEDFRNSVLEQNADYQLVLGPTSVAQLTQSYNIHEVYIEPDGLVVQPNERIAYLPGERRTPMDSILNEFLKHNYDVLIVLGDYGSGKSAWCAHVMHQLTSADAEFIPVYIALRHLVSADELANTVRQAVRVTRAYIGNERNIVLIADGFDEMPNAMDPQEKRFNMLRLIDAASVVSRLIVTARSSYFRGLEDFWFMFDTGTDSALWSRLAQHLPLKKAHMRVRAAILHGFNNDQITRYVEEVARFHGRSPAWAEGFFDDLKENDPHGMYRNLARNPLYLFLLVNTEPWKDDSVASIADVLELLIRYWLERDIAKGPSRWLLLTHDRIEFMTYLAWEMHHQQKLAVTHEEFGMAVRQFYRLEEPNDDSLAITLDLQTTGIFGSSGGTLYFLLPAVMDFFVAGQFARGRDLPPEGRLPTLDQGRIWLALLETGKVSGSLYLGAERVSVVEWFAKRGVRFDGGRQAISIDPAGILYKPVSSDFTWPIANKAQEEVVRILNHALHPPSLTLPNAIRVFMLNKYGLHARPSAEVCQAYQHWQEGRASTASLSIRYEGLYAALDSIMQVMCLAVVHATIFHLVFEGCSREDAEEYLATIGGHRVSTPEIDWELLMSI